jgi:putative solute:sodium symporter small subunit
MNSSYLENQDKTTDLNQTGPDLHRPEIHKLLESYWRKNVLLTIILLAIWAFVGLGCGVLFADRLNNYKLFGTGYPLGFWFAQQGSIIAFVIIVLVYCILMNRMDTKHHEELEQLKKEGKA